MTIVQSGRVANFLPSRNGFHFENRPPHVPDIVITLPFPGGPKIPIGDAAHGVCGGMCWAVIDYFTAQPRLYPPTRADIPPADDPLWAWLGSRLFDSFALGDLTGGNAVREFGFITGNNHDTWLSHGNAWHMVNEEWPKVKADIDTNTLATLYLVPATLADDAPVVPTNIPQIVDAYTVSHQVVCYGYDLDDQHNLTLWVYDPDDPGNDHASIGMNIGSPAHTSLITASSGAHWRAWFRANDYSWRQPVGSPGPLALNLSTSPAVIPLDQRITLTVTATDQTFGENVAGQVLMNNIPIGATNTPIQVTFAEKWHTTRHYDPATHTFVPGPSVEILPTLAVTADGYGWTGMHPKFSGGNPPPDEPVARRGRNADALQEPSPSLPTPAGDSESATSTGASTAQH